MKAKARARQKAASKAKKRKPKGPPRTRWEKSADNENLRRWNKAPLFVHAGLIPLATPEEREAKFGDARERAERGIAEMDARNAALAAGYREQVQARVSAEELAELDVKVERWGLANAFMFWGSVIRDLDKAAGVVEPVVAMVAAPRARVAQLPLFVVAEKTGADVPLVRDGKLRPVSDLAADGCETDPEKRVAEHVPPELRGPCPDCGWVSGGIFIGALSKVHPSGCPSLRAFLLGLFEQCADCKARGNRRDGSCACEAHRARTLTCALEGCVPGPAPKKPAYLADSPHQFCQRCWLNIRCMEEQPYLRPAEAA